MHYCKQVTAIEGMDPIFEREYQLRVRQQHNSFVDSWNGYLYSCTKFEFASVITVKVSKQGRSKNCATRS